MPPPPPSREVLRVIVELVAWTSPPRIPPPRSAVLPLIVEPVRFTGGLLGGELRTASIPPPSLWLVVLSLTVEFVSVTAPPARIPPPPDGPAVLLLTVEVVSVTASLAKMP